jgi:hypothetical protein
MPVSFQFLMYCGLVLIVLGLVIFSQILVYRSQKRDALEYSKWNEVYLASELEGLKDQKEFRKDEPAESGRIKLSAEAKRHEMKLANAVDMAKRRNGIEDKPAAPAKRGGGSMYH